MPNLEIMRPSGSKIENNCHIESSWRLDNLFWHQKQQRDVVRTVDLSSLSMFSVQKIISAKSQRSQQKKQRINDLPQPPSTSPPTKKNISNIFIIFSPPKKKQVPTNPGGLKTRPWRWYCCNYCWPCLMLMANHLYKVVPYNSACHPPTAPCYLAASRFSAVGSACLKGGSGWLIQRRKTRIAFLGTPPTFFFKDSNALSVLIGFWLGFIFLKNIARIPCKGGI